MSIGNLNWVALIACVVVGQIFLTIWFTILFGQQWAKAYGAVDRVQHTKEIPPYTYAIGAVCVLLLSIGLAVLQGMLSVTTLGSALHLGLFVALFFSIATALPGYAFLRKLDAFAIALASQTGLILLLSTILVLWN